MPQQSLITRLKAVEEALANSMPCAKSDSDYNNHSNALVDLRELIREAEESVPFGWYGDVHGFTDNQSDADEWAGRDHGVYALYTALGEKP